MLISMASRKKADQIIDDAQKACGCLKGIVHPVRIMILNLLRGGPMSVGELENELEMVKQSNLSQHLNQMRISGVLKSERDGSRIYYSAADPRIFKFIDLMKEIFCK